MGQYFKIVNLTKKEVVHPHNLNTGAKFREICNNNVGGVLLFLLRRSSQGGGGDIDRSYEYAGRWAGDSIVVIGDYDESGLYDEAREYRDISKEVDEEFKDFTRCY